MTPLPHRRTFAAVALVLALPLAACSTSTPPDPWMTTGNGPEDHSDALLADTLPGADVPGCAAAVARHGELAWSGAIGLASVADGAPLTPETRFDVSSVSKHVTALAALELARRDRLDLDATVSTYLAGQGAWANVVTVRQLVYQTSGLPDYIGILGDEGVKITDSVFQARALAALNDVTVPSPEPSASPTWAYSDSNHLVLASVIEAAEGEPFADVVARLLFEPTGADLAVDPVATYPEIARRYADPTRDSDELSVGWSVVGDGGIVASPVALATWFDVVRVGLPDDPGVGPAMLVDAVPIADTEGETYGAGVFITYDGIVWHSGGWEGHISYVSMAPDGSATIAVSCNAESLNNELARIALGLEQIWYPTEGAAS